MNFKLMISAALLAMCLSISCEPKQPAEADAPAVPTELKLVSATETSLAIQWSNVSDATGYEWKLSLGTEEIRSGSTSARHILIEELQAKTAYSFRVRSTNGSKASDYSQPLSAETLGSSEPEPGGGDEPDLSKYYPEFLMPEAEEDGLTRAFPGAEGCGMFTTGGRGGKVYHVKSLADSGAGTLRWALGQAGPRTIVFDVAGRIELQSILRINNGDVTIAGQTAPGDGICISGWTTHISSDNVIVRYVRFRMGDEGARAYKETMTDAQWKALSSLPMEDCIWGRNQKNIILDHCSFSWCIDEAASFYDNDAFTMQYCIVAESLNASFHPKGNHGYGGIWGGHGATFSHNLIAHHTSRTPRLCGSRYTGKPEDEKTELVNNVFYNWGPTNGGYAGEGGSFNFVRNYYKPGPSTASKNSIVNRIFAPNADDGSNKNVKGLWGSFFLDGNYFDSSCSSLSAKQIALCDNVNADNYAGLHPNGSAPESIRATGAFDISVNGSSVREQSAAEAYAAVLAGAGARGGGLKRDSIDERLVSEVRSGTTTYGNKGIIDSQSQIGGWPEYKATEEELDKAATDSDGDGMPDWFEQKFGLNKSDASDGNAKTLDKNKRYTNLEMYLHYLVRELL